MAVGAFIAGLVATALVITGYVICIAVAFAEDDPSDNVSREFADSDTRTASPLRIDGRALREPALVSDGAAARLHPPGFDPARIANPTTNEGRN